MALIQTLLTDLLATFIANQNSNNNFLNLQISNGWIPLINTFAYGTANAHTFTMTVPGNLAGTIGVGNKIQLTQTTTKYFIVTAISYTSPNTTITLYGGSDYALVNAAITAVYYSSAKAPFGFPLDPPKWCEVVMDYTQRVIFNPTLNVLYNLNGALPVGVGCWRTSFSACLSLMNGASGTQFAQIGLGTSTTVIDQSISAAVGGVLPTGGGTIRASVFKEKFMVVTAPSTFYLNSMMTSGSGINMYNENALEFMCIRAECAYL